MNNEPRTEPFLCGNIVYDKMTFYITGERINASINFIETTDYLKEKKGNIYIHTYHYISLYIPLYQASLYCNQLKTQPKLPCSTKGSFNWV